MDAREKGQVYGLAVKLAADTYDIDAFEDDSEYIGTVLLRADVFYVAMVKHQVAMFGTPTAVATAQKAVQSIVAATQSTVPPAPSVDPYGVPFGEEAPPLEVDSAALPEMRGTGLGTHDGSRWAITEKRCPSCGMNTLVANLMDKGPRFECSSRTRTKNPNTDEWQTVSACDYTAWG